MASHEQTVLDNLHLSEDIIHHLITVPTENANSFTALLELPPNQAVELLRSPNSSLKNRPVTGPLNPPPPPHFNASNLTFPTNAALIERAARFSVFAGEKWNTASSPETTPLNSSEKAVKIEPAEAESSQNQTPVVVSDPHPATEETERPVKRKGTEKKGKGLSKKSKSCGNDKCEDAEKLPYVHFRARRGQATDSHSLAERARREKINARMKLLQELVPGCNKISGTALVLDEIINHVQSLQRQVEFLSMRLADVNLKIDFDLHSVLSTESGSLMDSDFSSMVMPLAWPEVQVNGNLQHYQQQEWHCDAAQQQVWGREVGTYNFITQENSHLSYNSPVNSASLHSSQLKMEL